MTAALTVVTLGVGHFVYNANVRGSTLPGLIATLALGAGAFTALGVGLVRYISNAEAAPAVVNAAILPLTFISGIWFHSNLSPLITDIAKVFPIRPLAHALQQGDPVLLELTVPPAHLAGQDHHPVDVATRMAQRHGQDPQQRV